MGNNKSRPTGKRYPLHGRYLACGKTISGSAGRYPPVGRTWNEEDTYHALVHIAESGKATWTLADCPCGDTFAS
ncbi:MAG: hypothetical protein E7032_07525 [Akkermansiaceae bacterium]|nr:hypothetical protein [Akkermansiaceae bacterium]